MNVEKETVIRIIAGVLNKAEGELLELDESADLREIGLDSISSIDVIVSMESEFNIAVDDEDLLIDNFNTIEKLIKLLEKYTSNVTK
ncbi:MAG TPA: acyl carrier protein [Clostridia bacterium]|nr:acyl carrier protein [Clostridia bacterium]